MESLLVSTGVVALAEIGDKTQLLAFILAARFKKPVPIILGILVATIVNHGLAGALGASITSAVSPAILRWVLGLSFLGQYLKGFNRGGKVLGVGLVDGPGFVAQRHHCESLRHPDGCGSLSPTMSHRM